MTCTTSAVFVGFRRGQFFQPDLWPDDSCPAEAEASDCDWLGYVMGSIGGDSMGTMIPIPPKNMSYFNIKYEAFCGATSFWTILMAVPTFSKGYMTSHEPVRHPQSLLQSAVLVGLEMGYMITNHQDYGGFTNWPKPMSRFPETGVPPKIIHCISGFSSK